jgi:hypothetical protein
MAYVVDGMNNRIQNGRQAQQQELRWPEVMSLIATNGTTALF